MKFQQVWGNLKGSLWFVPSLLVLAAIGLAFLIVELDRRVGTSVAVALPLLFDAGPEGARALLSVIAGSLLTLASVAFSFAVVVFSFASSQYSSRTLRNFMDDRTNQAVLGVLMGSYVYCLLVLRTVRLENDTLGQFSFVPAISITVALILALCSLGFFIYFLHHITESIQAYHIINRLSETTCKVVKRIFSPPGESTTHAERAVGEVGEHQSAKEVTATSTGYIQAIDVDRLVKLAHENGLVVKLAKGVGQFLIEGRVVATASPANRVTEEVCERLRHGLLMGAHRTPETDALYGLLQLSDVAVKALSPGINDPTTALMCLDEIGHVLAHAARGRDPENVRRDEAGTVRVLLAPTPFGDLVGQAFNQVRRYGIADAAISQRMLEVIAEVAEETHDEARLEALRSHALAVLRDGDREIKSAFDRALVNGKVMSLSNNTQFGKWGLPLMTKTETS